VRACDLHRTAARALEKNGLPYSFQAVGHSLGLGLHEFPILRAGVEAEIEPGMVLAIEPAARDSQGFLYHVEDTLLVTDDGALVFTDVMRKDTLFVID
jgi:Xaa-Pro aminopeptidase